MPRVISGSARGIKLDVFPIASMRPTSERVKEALFDIIQFDIKGSTFLDLFSGTGQIAIEAVSRGASYVYAIENSFESMKIIRKNVSILKRLLGTQINLEVVFRDSFKFLNEFSGKVDILFADAPFDMNISHDVFSKFERVTRNLIITENLHKVEPIMESSSFYLSKRHKYGRVSLNVYKRK